MDGVGTGHEVNHATDEQPTHPSFGRVALELDIDIDGFNGSGPPSSGTEFNTVSGPEIPLIDHNDPRTWHPESF